MKNNLLRSLFKNNLFYAKQLILKKTAYSMKTDYLKKQLIQNNLF